MAKKAVPVVLMTAGAAAGGAGVAGVVAGDIKRVRAERQTLESWTAYEDRYRAHVAAQDQTNERLRAFGRSHEQVHDSVVLRMRDLLDRSGMRVDVADLHVLDSVEFSTTLQVRAQPKIDLDAEGWAQGMIDSARAGRTVWGLLHEGVNQIGRAGTGRPLEDLSGAAQEKARKAFLGGGPKSMGGGGQALGGWVEKVVTGGAVAFTVGAVAFQQGNKAQTEAERHRTALAVAVEGLELCDRLFDGVREQLVEKDHVLREVAARASKAIDDLGTGPLDPAIHGERFDIAWKLVKAVQQIAAAPVADEDGNLDPDTGRLIFKYRTRT
jgi:hypothetical protein